MAFKLIGADDITANGSTGANYFILTRFQAAAGGYMTEFRVKSSTSGNVKYALYADNSGEPGSLITAMDTGQAVTGGQWNTLSFTPTLISSGTYYWLAVNIDTADAVALYSSGGTMRYKAAAYSGFTFPNPAGSGFTSGTYYNIEAGWNGDTAIQSTDSGTGLEVVSLRDIGGAESGTASENSSVSNGDQQSLYSGDSGTALDGRQSFSQKTGINLELRGARRRFSLPDKEVKL